MAHGKPDTSRPRRRASPPVRSSAGPAQGGRLNVHCSLRTLAWRAFTLIEVLVVVAVIALLAAILLPSLAGARAEGRRAVCLSNLKQLGVATSMYLDENREVFWREYVEVFDGEGYQGRRWWFGFEPGGPPADVINTRNRPLDKGQGVMARYLRSTDDGLQCPAFPYDEGYYFPKFAGRSASYGYNMVLGPRNTALAPMRRSDLARRISEVFVFADGVLYDFEPRQRLNEGFFIQYIPNAAVAWGYGHFRHRGRSQVQYLDGHVAPQPLRGPAFAGGVPGAAPAGNLTSSSGSHRIYAQDRR